MKSGLQKTGTSLLLLISGACTTSPAMIRLNDSFTNLSDEFSKVRKELAQQRELNSLYTCRIEFRAMYREIREECAANARRLGRMPKVCPPEVISEAIGSLQKRLGVPFSLLVREKFLHTVAYLGALHEDGTLQAKSSKANTLHKSREDILNFALAYPWPDSMRILLITPPSPRDRPDQVQQRLDWVRNYLTRRGLPASSIEPSLIYDLEIGTDSLQTIEKAVPPEIDDLSTAVWIIRLDCPAGLTQVPISRTVGGH